MLKTNTKKVQERIKQHILEYYSKDELKHQLKAFNYLPTNYHKMAELVNGGCFLIYYGDIREFLKETLEETNEEADKYDDQKVWDLYKHLIALNGEKIANQ